MECPKFTPSATAAIDHDIDAQIAPKIITFKPKFLEHRPSLFKQEIADEHNTRITVFSGFSTNC